MMRRMALVKFSDGELIAQLGDFKVRGFREGYLKVEGDLLPPTEEGANLHRFESFDDLVKYLEYVKEYGR